VAIYYTEKFDFPAQSCKTISFFMTEKPKLAYLD